MIAFSADYAGDSNMTTALLIIILFLPNLLIAIFTTVGRKNYRALLHHPLLLLLPTFTMFSYQKLRSGAGCCGETDGKIVFSKKMSMCNMLINGVSFGVIGGLFLNGTYFSGLKWNIFQKLEYLLIPLPLLIASIIFSLIFMFMEKCCGCCLAVACCNIKDQARIYDPALEDVEDQEAVEMEQ